MKIHTSSIVGVFFAVLSGAAAGCFRVDLEELAKEPPVKQRYLLEVEDPTAQAEATGPVLLVEQVHAVPPYNGRSFVYRVGDQTYSVDFYNEFLVAPAEQLSQIARRWLRAAGGFAAVVDPDSRLVADRVLSLDLTDLRGDLREPTEPAASLALRAVVLQTGSGVTEPRQLLQRDYSARIRIADDSAGALVAGWNTCLAQVLTALAADLRGLSK